MSLYTETILPPRNTRVLPRWFVAALIVLALHIGIGAYLILTRQIGMPPGQPPDALLINLAPVTASPPQPQQEVQHETVPEEPAVMSKPLPLQPPVPTILQTPLVPHAEAVLAPKPVPQKKVEEKKEKKVQKQKRERAEQARPTHQLARHATAPAPGFSGKSEASWLSEVRERIEAAKRYPDDARPAQGTAILAFVVDTNGSVVGAQITRSPAPRHSTAKRSPWPIGSASCRRRPMDVCQSPCQFAIRSTERVAVSGADCDQESPSYFRS